MPICMSASLGRQFLKKTCAINIEYPSWQFLNLRYSQEMQSLLSAGITGNV